MESSFSNLARLAADAVGVERQHGIEQVVQQLEAQRASLGRARGQRLQHEARLLEVVLVRDAAKLRDLAEEGARRAGRRGRTLVSTRRQTGAEGGDGERQGQRAERGTR